MKRLKVKKENYILTNNLINQVNYYQGKELLEVVFEFGNRELITLSPEKFNKKLKGKIINSGGYFDLKRLLQQTN